MREMKESNISWVGKMPCNWIIEKNKHCLFFFIFEEIILAKNLWITFENNRNT